MCTNEGRRKRKQRRKIVKIMTKRSSLLTERTEKNFREKSCKSKNENE